MTSGVTKPLGNLVGLVFGFAVLYALVRPKTKRKRVTKPAFALRGDAAFEAALSDYGARVVAEMQREGFTRGLLRFKDIGGGVPGEVLLPEPVSPITKARVVHVATRFVKDTP